MLIDRLREKFGPRALLNRIGDWYEEFFPLPKNPRVHSAGYRGWGGGITKFRWLHQFFPHYERRYNIIYAVHTRVSYAKALKAKKRGVKIVYSGDGVFTPAYYPENWEVRNKNELQGVYKLADYIFFQSEFAKSTSEKFLGITNTPNEILYNAVDTNMFVPKARKTNSKDFVLLAAGSHHWFYKLETTLKAFKILAGEIPNARLLIAGTLRAGEGIWNVKGRVEELVGELALEDRVDFSSTYSFSEAPAVYQQAEVLIHATWNDVCPNTVIEAMACGLPVIYSASGGTPELVGKEAGIGIAAQGGWDKIDVPSHQAIAEAVIKIMDARQQFSEAARTRAVEMFDIEYWAERHKAVFEQVLDQGN